MLNHHMELRLNLKKITHIFLLSCTLLFSLTPSISFAASVSIVTSQLIPVYEQAFEGFNNIYRGETKRYDLNGSISESEKVVRDIRDQHPDLIFAIGLLAATVAKENFSKIPIVFCMVVDPERFSLSGDNITGITLDIPVSRTLSQTKGILPEVRKIGMLYDPLKNRTTADHAEKMGGKMGFSLIRQKVTTIRALPNAIRNILLDSDLLWIIPDSTIITPESIEYILSNSLEERVPIITFSEDLVRKGAFMAFSPDYVSIGEQAGHIVMSIMDGRSPGSIPIQSADKTRLVINKTTAERLGIILTMKAVDPNIKIILYE